MNAASAFEILGLPSSATDADIEERYRELAREKHPDAGGSEDDMRQLNVARDVANEAVKPGPLVPLEVAQSLVITTARAIAERGEAREEAQQAIDAAKHSATGVVRRYKDMSLILGGLSVATLFLGKDLPATYFEGVGASNEFTKEFILAALTIGMCAAVAYWQFNNRVTRIEQQVDDLRKYLSTRSGFATVWFDITDPYLSEQGWTLAELQELVSGWSAHKQRDRQHREGEDRRRLARLIGERDFTHLLLTKGNELELLKSNEAVEGHSLIERYSLQLHSKAARQPGLKRTPDGAA